MLIVRKGPTSHLPLHDTRHQDTIEIPPTEILGRIFTVLAPGGRGCAKNPAKRFLLVAVVVLIKEAGFV